MRLAAQLRGVVDAHTILDKRFIATGIMGLTGIDRYLEEGTTSAAQRFQRDGEHCAPYALEMASQLLRDNCTHMRIPPVFQGIWLSR